MRGKVGSEFPRIYVWIVTRLKEYKCYKVAQERNELTACKLAARRPSSSRTQHDEHGVIVSKITGVWNSQKDQKMCNIQEKQKNVVPPQIN